MNIKNIDKVKTLKVLYVEDDDGYREETLGVLELIFDNVDIGCDGEDGLKMYQNYKQNNFKYYDIVMTDINMPKKNGIEMTRDIMNINPNQQVVVISAYNDSNRLFELINLGISNFLLKPFDTDSLIKVINNITEKHFLKQEILELEIEKEKNKYIKSIQEDKLSNLTTLLDNIAHHWRQPLSVISTAASGLEIKMELDGNTNQEYNELIDTLVTTSSQLSTTIEQFKKIYSKDKKNSNFKIDTLIQDTIKIIETKVQNKDIQLHSNSLDITLDSYKVELQQVINSILSNSCEAFDESNIKKKHIFIDIMEENSDMIISIKDNALGIKDEIVQKVFEPYFTTKHQSYGKGMGLYISKEIINRYFKGDINIRNTKFVYEGKDYSGTEVQITIPKSKQEEN